MMLVQHSSAVPEPRQPLSLEHGPIHNAYDATTETATHHTSITSIALTQPRPTFTVRDATLADADSIVRIGASTFSATFGFSMPATDLQAYLDEAYALSAIEADIQDASKHVVVACFNATEDVIGFAQLTEGTTEPCLQGMKSTVELQRLYVSREAQGLGVGKALVRRTEEMAKRLGYLTIWLGVWEGNFVAQQVYEKLGYRRVGDHEFKMGRCIQTDWIMARRLRMR